MQWHNAMSLHIYFTFVLTVQLTSCLLVNPVNPTVDMTSVVNHISLMGDSIRDLERQAQTSQNLLTIVKADLKNTQDRLKYAEAKIVTLEKKLNADVAFQATETNDHRNWTTLHFDRVDFNTGGGYNSTSGYFTAPIAGTYLFWSNILLFETTGYVYIYKVKGTVRLAQGLTYAKNNEASMTVVTHLDVGDQVEFVAGSIKINIDGGESHYGGTLLHAS